MQCLACRHENPAQAKFCLECGARLVVSCSHCRTELPPSAKFCLECGERVTPAGAAMVSPSASPEAYTPKHLAERILTVKAALEGERKQVTVLFADLKGSMELLADRDPEEARKLLDPVLERMIEAVPLAAACHACLGRFFRETGNRKKAREHLSTAASMYREMGMSFRLEQAETEMKELT